MGTRFGYPAIFVLGFIYTTLFQLFSRGGKAGLLVVSPTCYYLVLKHRRHALVFCG